MASGTGSSTASRSPDLASWSRTWQENVQASSAAPRVSECPKAIDGRDEGLLGPEKGHTVSPVETGYRAFTSQEPARGQFFMLAAAGGTSDP